MPAHPLHHSAAVAIIAVLTVLVLPGCGCSGSPPQAAPPAPINRDIDWKTASNEDWAERITQEWTAAPIFVHTGFLKDVVAEPVVACQLIEGKVTVKRALYASDHTAVTKKRFQGLDIEVTGKVKLWYDVTGRGIDHTMKNDAMLLLAHLPPATPLPTTLGKAKILEVTYEGLVEMAGTPTPAQ